MSNIPTPHINAPEGAFARTVLMPGDPLRSKFIAETYLENAVLVNNVRGVQGYTGEYKGKRVSVMASGMGMPSIGIYSYELFNFYGVENIIRIGSAGALTDKLKLRDVVAAMSAYTDSNYGHQFGFHGTLAPCCSYELLDGAVKAAEKLGQPVVPGPICSSDAFYAQGDYSSTADPAEAGRAVRGDGGLRAVPERRRRGQERPGAADHLRQPGDRREPARRGPPDHLHPHDGDRAGDRVGTERHRCFSTLREAGVH